MTNTMALTAKVTALEDLLEQRKKSTKAPLHRSVRLEIFELELKSQCKIIGMTLWIMKGNHLNGNTDVDTGCCVMLVQVDEVQQR